MMETPEHTHETLEEPECAPRSVPCSVRVAALASMVGLRDSSGDFALDACVPVRTEIGVDASSGLEWRAYLVLAHIDGARSLQEISASTTLPVSETVTTCFDLVARGLVHVGEVAS
jgi:hypothetical protein